jgi:hypothetical protein
MSLSLRYLPSPNWSRKRSITRIANAPSPVGWYTKHSLGNKKGDLQVAPTKVMTAPAALP